MGLHAIVWQCTRTREICQKLIDDGMEPHVKESTGLVSATYFSGPKIKWILDEHPELKRPKMDDKRRKREQRKNKAQQDVGGKRGGG